MTTFTHSGKRKRVVFYNPDDAVFEASNGEDMSAAGNGPSSFDETFTVTGDLSSAADLLRGRAPVGFEGTILSLTAIVGTTISGAAAGIGIGTGSGDASFASASIGAGETVLNDPDEITITSTIPADSEFALSVDGAPSAGSATFFLTIRWNAALGASS